jgi:hypothetical protein
LSPRQPTRTYVPLLKASLEPGSFATLSGTTTSDNGLERTVTSLNATNATRFYGVQITCRERRLAARLRQVQMWHFLRDSH